MKGKEGVNELQREGRKEGKKGRGNKERKEGRKRREGRGRERKTFTGRVLGGGRQVIG